MRFSPSTPFSRSSTLSSSSTPRRERQLCGLFGTSFPRTPKQEISTPRCLNLPLLDDPFIPSLVPLGKLPPCVPNPGARHFRTVEQHPTRNLIIFFIAIRSAYLPTSAVWYDFYTRQKVMGGEVGDWSMKTIDLSFQYCSFILISLPINNGPLSRSP